jgi:hypothetical protein
MLSVLKEVTDFKRHTNYFVPVVQRARDVMILMRAYTFQGPIALVMDLPA